MLELRLRSGQLQRLAGEPPVQRPVQRAQFGEVSPDGRWLAYESNESGRDAKSTCGRSRRSDRPCGRFRRTGARGRCGRGAGSELFYLDESGALTARRSWTSGPTLAATHPRGCSRRRYGEPHSIPAGLRRVARWSAFPHDQGQRPCDPNGTPASMVVVLNWSKS